MAAITISELTPSLLTEIDTDEMGLIKGGKIGIVVDPKLLEALPLLESVNGFVVTQTILDDIDSLSLGDSLNLFALVPVVSADEVSTPGPQITRRGLVF